MGPSGRVRSGGVQFGDDDDDDDDNAGNGRLLPPGGLACGVNSPLVAGRLPAERSIADD